MCIHVLKLNDSVKINKKVLIVVHTQDIQLHATTCICNHQSKHIR